MIASNDPKRPIRWPILRIQPGHQTELRLLAVSWVSLGTHYHGRTRLCIGREVCPVCQYLPARDYWYLPISVGGRPMLLELSSYSSTDLATVCNLHFGRFRAGQTVVATRRGHKSPIKFEPLTDGPIHDEPKPEQWVSAVMAIYGLPPMIPGETINAYRDRLLPMATDRAHVLANEISGGV